MILSLAFALKLKRAGQKTAFVFLSILLAGLLSPTDGQTKHDGPITLGPVTIGKPLPSLPKCPLFGDHTETVAPCIASEVDDYGGLVKNIPYEGAELWVEMETCVEGKCVGEVHVDIAESECREVLAKLKTKFGPPRATSYEFQNGYGARWIGSDYIWPQRNGTLLTLVIHTSDRLGGFLRASTASHRKANAAPEVKFERIVRLVPECTSLRL